MNDTSDQGIAKGGRQSPLVGGLYLCAGGCGRRMGKGERRKEKGERRKEKGDPAM
jgi:hypothetical protein